MIVAFVVNYHLVNAETLHLQSQWFQTSHCTSVQYGDQKAVDISTTLLVAIQPVVSEVVEDVVQPVLVNVVVVGLRGHTQDDLLFQSQEPRYYNEEELIPDTTQTHLVVVHFDDTIKSNRSEHTVGNVPTSRRSKRLNKGSARRPKGLTHVLQGV